MIKICCNRCGKEIAEEVFTLNITKKSVGDIVLFDGVNRHQAIGAARCAASQAVLVTPEPTRTYCGVCMVHINAGIQDAEQS